MDTCPSDCILVDVFFQDGGLGVTLRRRPDEGEIFIHDIVPDSQAVNLDVAVGDVLWGVGESVIGMAKMDKDAWSGLIQYIKTSPRPLHTIWRRKCSKSMGDDIESPLSETSATSTIVEPITDRASSVDIKSNDSTEAGDGARLRSTSISTSHRETNGDDTNEILVAKTAAASEKQENETNEEGEEVEEEDDDDEEAENNLMLQEYSSRLFIRSKEKTSLIPNIFNIKLQPVAEALVPYDLIREGRKLLKYGELMIIAPGNNAKSAHLGTGRLGSGTFTLRTILLLTDVIIVAEPQGNGNLFIDNIIDLQVCKLRIIMFPFDPYFVQNLGNMISKDRCQQIFEVISPLGSIQALSETVTEREMWSKTIARAIGSSGIYSVGSGRSIGWNHEYLLGTMHSAVVCRDEALVKEIILSCEDGQLDFSIIDLPDEDGYTPIHYACILRLSSIMKLLHAASADVNIPDRRGWTPIHWAAMQLDDVALDILTAHSFDVDMEDDQHRSPLFLACVEGRDRHGKQNAEAMLLCMRKLLNLNADVNVTDKNGVPLLHHLASTWNYDAIELLLDYKYKAEILSFDRVNGRNAFHHAVSGCPVDRLSGLSSRAMQSSFSRDPSGGINTLVTLLKAGARPNGRDIQGRSPLSILADNCESWGNSVNDAVKILVSYGARFDDSPAALSLKSKNVDAELQELLELRSTAPVIDADDLGISALEVVREVNTVVYPAASEGSNAKDKGAPLCVLCSINFTLFRRQHHCRLCEVLCCDDCSKRRSQVDSTQIRICDTCYNRSASLAEKVEFFRSESASARSNSGGVSTTVSPVKSKKQELFGSATSSQDTKAKQGGTASGLGATASVMSEAHERLMERGEKLSKLSDKTADMANSANEFAKMAKQLHSQQKNRWF